MLVFFSYFIFSSISLFPPPSPHPGFPNGKIATWFGYGNCQGSQSSIFNRLEAFIYLDSCREAAITFDAISN